MLGGIRGVMMRWTGVDMVTPLFPWIVREIDANPVSFFTGLGGDGRGGGVSYVGSVTRQFAKYGKSGDHTFTAYL